jgi:hypothetical protein
MKFLDFDTWYKSVSHSGRLTYRWRLVPNMSHMTWWQKCHSLALGCMKLFRYPISSHGNSPTFMQFRGHKCKATNPYATTATLSRGEHFYSQILFSAFYYCHWCIETLFGWLVAKARDSHYFDILNSSPLHCIIFLILDFPLHHGETEDQMLLWYCQPLLIHGLLGSRGKSTNFLHVFLEFQFHTDLLWAML